MGCLYAITFENGKKYIGVTKHTASYRFNQHVRYTRDRATTLNRALKKYGAASCVVSTLVIAKDLEYLKELEVKAIAAYGSLRPSGYNSTLGGNGVRDPSGLSEGQRISGMKQTMALPQYKEKQRTVQAIVWDDDRRQQRAKEIALKWKDPEYRARLVKAHTGKKRSPEAIERGNASRKATVAQRKANALKPLEVQTNAI